MYFKSKILAAFAVLAVAVFGFAGPAAASTTHGCPDDTLCLYQWTGYGAPAGATNPGWKSSFYNLSIHPNGCINLFSPNWPNGTPVNNNSASLIVNGSGAYSGKVYVSVYNDENCIPNDGVASFNANWSTGTSDLHTLQISASQNAYHTITSVQIASV